MRLKATVDRFEADKVVLIVEEEKAPLVLSRALLPKETKEGDVLLITLEIDKEATEQSKEETTKLIRKLREETSDR